MGVELIMAQKLCYPMRYVNISQGSNGEYSHKGKYAIDLCGADSSSEPVFAQGTGVVTEIVDAAVTVRYSNVVGQSGTKYDYVDVRCYHQTADKGIKVGQRLRRGQVYMHEGMIGNATGNHVHCTCKGYINGKAQDLMPERMFTFNPTYNKQVKNKSVEPVRFF